MTPMAAEGAAADRAMAEAVSPERRPFSIGLKPIAPDAILDVDARRAADLAEKRRLLAQDRVRVWRAQPETQAAQREARATVRAALGADAPPIDPSAPPLLDAALCVQEDLVLMARREDGWSLAAASVCFPSLWSLDEKFGLPIHEIHARVPGFAAGRRDAVVLARVFDALKPGAPVERFGWSLQGDARLPTFPDAPRAELLTSPHLRVERQTLTKLAHSDAILFTIRIHIRRLEGDLARRAAAKLGELTAEQLDYKGAAQLADRLIARLSAA